MFNEVKMKNILKNLLLVRYKRKEVLWMSNKYLFYHKLKKSSSVVEHNEKEPTLSLRFFADVLNHFFKGMS